MSYSYHTTDVFTNEAFGGNQLAVLPDARGLSTEQMQRLAREFNLSETVFVFPPDNSANTRKVRIFTPGVELPFAGHPTVGTAFVLAVTGEIQLDGDETRIVLEEGVGPVHVVIRSENGKPSFAQLSAARMPAIVADGFDVEMIAGVLSLDTSDIDVASGYAIEAVSAGVPFLMVPVRSQDALSRARINASKWEAGLMGTPGAEMFVFTEVESSKARNGASEGDAVFRARMFAPTFGIVEDPATGGACAAFGGYLAWRSSRRDGTLRYTVHQGVEMGRPSLIDVESDVVDGTVTAVRVGGAAVLVSSGTLHVV